MKKNIICILLTILLTATAVQAQDNWNNQNPVTKPPVMLEHAMAYIGDDKVLVFGGEFGETWVYDLSDNNWTQKITTSTPSTRFYHAMARVGDDQVLLYGGSADLFSVIPLNETWVYDLSDNTWTLESPSANPSGRVQHTMASLGGGQALLFGGDGSGNDTWVYDLSANTWTLKTPAISPGGAVGLAMANIGGDMAALFGVNGDQTWVYDLSDNLWTQKNPASKPGARNDFTMASLGTDQVIIFGGLCQFSCTDPIFDNTWVYDLSDNTWTQKNPASKPNARYIHAMAAISSNEVILFAGYPFNDETWLYTAPPCTMTVSAGADENLYFGYAADQCVTKTAVVTDGTFPFTYSWTLNRALLPGETITGSGTASVTVCLLDTAELCVTVTDGAGCVANDCATIFAEDVRCSTGNSSNQKVKVCHNGNTICVESTAVNAHIAHGDYVGQCTGNVRPQSDNTIEENSKEGFIIYPNPGNGNCIISIDRSINADNGTIRVLNMSGQLVKKLNVQQQNRISLNIKDPGVYIVQLVNGKETITKKLIVH